jgi:hypothetical protein
MHRIKTITLSIAAVLMAGCSNMGPQYTKDDYKVANKYCLDQSNADKREMNRQWFTRWMSCAQERIMPIEIAYYPAKESDIKQMYEKLFVLAKESLHNLVAGTGSASLKP